MAPLFVSEDYPSFLQCFEIGTRHHRWAQHLWTWIELLLCQSSTQVISDDSFAQLLTFSWCSFASPYLCRWQRPSGITSRSCGTSKANGHVLCRRSSAEQIKALTHKFVLQSIQHRAQPVCEGLAIYDTFIRKKFLKLHWRVFPAKISGRWVGPGDEKLTFAVLYKRQLRLAPGFRSNLTGILKFWRVLGTWHCFFWWSRCVTEGLWREGLMA